MKRNGGICPIRSITPKKPCVNPVIQEDKRGNSYPQSDKRLQSREIGIKQVENNVIGKAESRAIDETSPK